MSTISDSYDPFSARPMHAPFVQAKENQGRVQLRLTPSPESGWHAFLVRHFSMFPFRVVCLDEHGTFYWRQINGTRTLAEIEQNLREKYRMEERGSRDAVILFTKMLMRRSLIALKLPARETAAFTGNIHG